MVPFASSCLSSTGYSPPPSWCISRTMLFSTLARARSITAFGEVCLDGDEGCLEADAPRANHPRGLWTRCEIEGVSRRPHCRQRDIQPWPLMRQPEIDVLCEVGEIIFHASVSNELELANWLAQSGRQLGPRKKWLSSHVPSQRTKACASTSARSSVFSRSRSEVPKMAVSPIHTFFFRFTRRWPVLPPQSQCHGIAFHLPQRQHSASRRCSSSSLCGPDPVPTPSSRPAYLPHMLLHLGVPNRRAIKTLGADIAVNTVIPCLSQQHLCVKLAPRSLLVQDAPK